MPLLRVLLALLAPAILLAQDPPKDPGLTVEQLLDRLKSPDKAPRASAMRALGQRKARAAVAPIAACLADPDEQIRVAALEALADIGDASAVPSVVGCLGDPSASVLIAAIRASARFPAQEVVPSLIGVLDHPQVGIRQNAFEALRGLTRLDFGYDPEAPPEDRAKRIGTWRAWWAKAGGREPAGGQGPLVGWQGQLAGWWRGELGSPLASHRASCARALGEASSVDAVPDLLPLLEDPETPVRFEAGRALVAITTFDLSYDAYASPEERQLSVDRWKRWWRDHQGKPRREWLESGLTDSLPRNRKAAIVGLQSMGTPDVVPALIAALDDREEGVRASANDALLAITGRDAGFDPSATEQERLVACARWEQWWAENKGRRPMDWWEAALLSDERPANRAEAARRLGGVKDWESIRYLVQGLEDEAPGVRAAALQALSQLTGETLRFDADAPDADRAAAIGRWQGWMSEHRDTWKPPQ